MTDQLDLGLARPLLPIPGIYRAEAAVGRVGDAAGAFTYVFTKEIGLAVNAALATRRPLLLRGAPGSGKSSLARAVAGVSKRSLITKVVTSDSRLDDLLFAYDHVRRLQDASHPKHEGVLDDHEYVEPQALFWALAPAAALRRGHPTANAQRPVLPPAGDPPVVSTPPVLLLDEIDKADPALPNDLLGTLGEGRFRIRETGHEVQTEEGRDPLVLITTNEERELPRPFLRRCVVLELPQRVGDDLEQWLVQVGDAHFAHGDDAERRKGLVRALAKAQEAFGAETREPPSAAEFVDLVRTCIELAVGPDHPTFDTLRRLVVTKMRRRDEG